jgi:hypothetical protein
MSPVSVNYGELIVIPGFRGADEIFVGKAQMLVNPVEQLNHIQELSRRTS